MTSLSQITYQLIKLNINLSPGNTGKPETLSAESQLI